MINDAVEVAAAKSGGSEAAREALDLASRLARSRLLDSIEAKGGTKPPTMIIGAPDTGGRRIVTILGTANGDWTVEWRVVLRADGDVRTINVSDGDYAYPADWDLVDVPARAELVFGSGSIYDGDDRHGLEFTHGQEVVVWPEHGKARVTKL